MNSVIFFLLLSLQTTYAFSSSQIQALKTFVRDSETLSHLSKFSKVNTTSPWQKMARDFQLDLEKKVGLPTNVEMYSYEQEEQKQGFGMVVSVEPKPGEVAAYSTRIFLLNEKSKWETALGYVRKNPDYGNVHGFARSITDSAKSILPQFGFKQDSILCDWLGRYVWAKYGYKVDRDSKVVFDGDEITLGKLIQGNYERFKEFYEIDDSEVCIACRQGACPLEGDLDLSNPLSLSKLKLCSNKKISIKAHTDIGEYSDQKLDLGMAFILAPAGKSKDQQSEVFYPEYPEWKMSDRSMPMWKGYLDLGN